MLFGPTQTRIGSYPGAVRCTGMRMAGLALVAVVAACSEPATRPGATVSPTPSTPPVAQISVTKVTIHTGVDTSHKFQNPLYTYALARGHYIVATQAPISGRPFVAYDGRQLANTPNYVGALHLSSDGTHYGYQTYQSSGATDVYLDGKLYVSAPTGLQLFAVTNAGEPVDSTFARRPDAVQAGRPPAPVLLELRPS